MKSFDIHFDRMTHEEVYTETYCLLYKDTMNITVYITILKQYICVIELGK